MGKREVNMGKQAKRRRETNAQRRERERKRWAILQIANWIVWRINSRRLAQQQGNGSSGDYLPKLIDRSMADKDAWMENESIENITNGLRLAADMLEATPSDGRTFSAHNSQIVTALLEAGNRVAQNCPCRARVLYEDSGHRIIWALPTFSEFLWVYRKQNPGAKVEDRTLRRTLERLHLPTLPGKRGRPKGK